MGSGYKNFTAGSVLTAADVNGYLMRQGVMSFATAAARDSALSGVLAEGMRAWTSDVDTEWLYDGAQWLIVSEPWQSWTPTVTQSNTPTKTVTDAGYQRTRSGFQAYLNVTFTAAGTAANVVLITLPVTAPTSSAVGGSWVYADVGNTTFAGSIGISSTTQVALQVDQAGTSQFGVLPAITIASTDVLRAWIHGRY